MSLGDVAAEYYARIVPTRRATRAPIEGFDALVAATAAADVGIEGIFGP